MFLFKMVVDHFFPIFNHYSRITYIKYFSCIVPNRIQKHLKKVKSVRWHFNRTTNVFFCIRQQAWILAPGIGQCLAKTEICPKKTALQRTRLSYVKLKFFFNTSYRRFKTQKYSVSVSLSCSCFSCYEHFNR